MAMDLGFDYWLTNKGNWFIFLPSISRSEHVFGTVELR